MRGKKGEKCVFRVMKRKGGGGEKLRRSTPKCLHFYDTQKSEGLGFLHEVKICIRGMRRIRGEKLFVVGDLVAFFFGGGGYSNDNFE